MVQKVLVKAEYLGNSVFECDTVILRDLNITFSDVNEHIMMEHQADPDTVPKIIKYYDEREDELPHGYT